MFAFWGKIGLQVGVGKNFACHNLIAHTLALILHKPSSKRAAEWENDNHLGLEKDEGERHVKEGREAQRREESCVNFVKKLRENCKIVKNAKFFNF